MDSTAFQEGFQDTWKGSTGDATAEATAEDTVDAPGNAAAGATDVDPVSAIPALLEIPRIAVREEVFELGLDDVGALEVPDEGDDVGWYSPDAIPGGAYPTVFTGHVDTATGPAVFARLPELEPGDEVVVTDAGGRVHAYRVDRVEDQPVDAFPTREVFGPATDDEIRLLTCTGDFDVLRQQYEENRVVYASRSR